MKDSTKQAESNATHSDAANSDLVNSDFKKTKKQLIEELEQLKERDRKRNEDIKLLELDVETTKVKSEELLKKVAKWESTKDIILEDQKKSLQNTQKKLTIEIANLCNFLYEMSEVVNKESQVMCLSKIENLENNFNLEVIETEIYDRDLHSVIANTSSEEVINKVTKIKTCVAKGYKYNGDILTFAKVIL